MGSPALPGSIQVLVHETPPWGHPDYQAESRDALVRECRALRSAGVRAECDLLGNKLCGNSGFGPSFSFRCRIRTSGRYVLAASNSGSFTPLVVHPTRTRISVKGSRVPVVTATIRSDAPNPVGRVASSEDGARGSRSRMATTAGSCKQTLRATRHGSLQLACPLQGRDPGRASSTSESVAVPPSPARRGGDGARRYRRAAMRRARRASGGRAGRRSA